MRNIKEIVEEAIKQENLAGSLRAELEQVEGSVYRPTVKEFLLGRYTRPTVQVEHGSYLIGYEVMHQRVGLRNGLPRVLWHPTELHMHEYDHEGELRSCMQGIADRHGPIMTRKLQKVEPALLPAEGQYLH